MLSCDVRGIFISKTMEFLDFEEIFRGAERANEHRKLLRHMVII